MHKELNLSNTERAAREIIANNWLEQQGREFRVCSPDDAGSLDEFRVRRNLRHELTCSCPIFRDRAARNPLFQCEHVMAVEISLSGTLTKLETVTPEPPPPEKWRCHHRTKLRLEALIGQLIDAGVDHGEIIRFIQQESGNKRAPADLLEEAAEDIELRLKGWILEIKNAGFPAAA